MLNKKIIFVLLCVIVLVTSCQISPTSMSTVRPVHTITPIDSSTALVLTATPTLTSYPPLIKQGPYLMYAKYFGGHGPFVITDASLQSRKMIEMPDDIYIYNLRYAVSPDGKWLAFHTGSTDVPYDLTLNLLSLPDGPIRPIAKIFSREYPNNIEPVADFYKKQGYHELEVEHALGTTIRAFDWSPDGQHLAFAGQMDGPSSDLYVYDVQTGKVRRLTDDLYILNGGITWSPDGKWLLINDTTPSLVYPSKMLHRIKADSDTVKSLPILEQGTWWTGLGWMSDNIYLLTNQGDGGDPHELHYLDVETGKMHGLWPGSYFSYAVNPQDMAVAVNGLIEKSADSESLQMSSFVISMDGKKMPLSQKTNWIIGFKGGKNPYFVGISNGHFATFDSAGVVARSEDEQELIKNMSTSPDGEWFILFDEDYARHPLTLFSADRKQKHVFSDLDARWVVWRDDSLGFFVAGVKALHYISLPNEESVKVDECLSDEKDCEFSRDLVWLP